MNYEPKRLGNYYGDHFSTGYAGNFYSVEAISPTLNTAAGGGREMQILDIKEEQCLESNRQPRVVS